MQLHVYKCSWVCIHVEDRIVSSVIVPQVLIIEMGYHFLDQVGLELAEFCLPLSSRVLGLKAYTITPSSTLLFGHRISPNLKVPKKAGPLESPRDPCSSFPRAKGT